MRWPAGARSRRCLGTPPGTPSVYWRAARSDSGTALAHPRRPCHALRRVGPDSRKAPRGHLQVSELAHVVQWPHIPGFVGRAVSCHCKTFRACSLSPPSHDRQWPGHKPVPAVFFCCWDLLVPSGMWDSPFLICDGVENE
jgi:hypothetical protein